MPWWVPLDKHRQHVPVFSLEEMSWDRWKHLSRLVFLDLKVVFLVKTQLQNLLKLLSGFISVYIGTERVMFSEVKLRVCNMYRGGWEECGFECKVLEDWNGQHSKISHPCTYLLKFSARPGCCLGKHCLIDTAQSQETSRTFIACERSSASH